MKMDDIRSMFFFIVTWQTCFALGIGITASFKGVGIPGTQPELAYGWPAFLWTAGMATAGSVWLALVFAAFMWLFSKR